MVRSGDDDWRLLARAQSSLFWKMHKVGCGYIMNALPMVFNDPYYVKVGHPTKSGYVYRNMDVPWLVGCLVLDDYKTL